MKKQIITIVIVSFMCLTAFGQTDTTYNSVLKKMIKVSNVEASFDVAIKQMFTMFKKQYPDLESSIWVDMEKEFNSTAFDELMQMLEPVYSKYLSIEDLHELIKFYESPIGMKFGKQSTLIMQESMQIGQEWGLKIGEEFQKKMKVKGY
jgi:hypothetical protein